MSKRFDIALGFARRRGLSRGVIGGDDEQATFVGARHVQPAILRGTAMSEVE